MREKMRVRAAAAGVPFDARYFTCSRITRALESILRCPCCDVAFDIDKTPRNGAAISASPTLDRIVPQRGYVAGNVALICFRCNFVKRASTARELYLVAVWARKAETAQIDPLGAVHFQALGVL